MRFLTCAGVFALVLCVLNPAASAQVPDPKIMIGHDAPDFSLSTLDGETVTLSSLKGKVVVLDFWATWCRPCRIYLPDVIAVTNEFKDRDVVLYTVNLKDAEDLVKRFVELTKLDAKVLLDATGSVGQEYLVSSIPQTVIVNKEGKIAVVHVGAASKTTLRKDLKQLTSPGAPAAEPEPAAPAAEPEQEKAQPEAKAEGKKMVQIGAPE